MIGMEKIETSLKSLYNNMSEVIPKENILENPFTYYSEHIKKIIECINEINLEFLDIKRNINKEISEYWEKIEKYSHDLEIPTTKMEPVFNLNLKKMYYMSELRSVEMERYCVKNKITNLASEIFDIKKRLDYCMNGNSIIYVSVLEHESPYDSNTDVLTSFPNGKDSEITNIRITKKNLLSLQKEKVELDALIKEKEKQRDSIFLSIVELSNELNFPVSVYQISPILELESTNRKLIKLKNKRYEEYEILLHGIRGLERDLEKESLDIKPDLTIENIEYLVLYKTRLKKEYLEKFVKIFEKTKLELEEIETIFGIENTIYERNEESLDLMKKRLNDLYPKKELFCNIIEEIEKRKLLIEKMMDFEAIASDPTRLFRSSFQLNSEERFRNSAYPTLLNLESNLISMVKEYEEKFGKFVYMDQPYLDVLKKEIEGRIINRAVFRNRCSSPCRKKQ